MQWQFPASQKRSNTLNSLLFPTELLRDEAVLTADYQKELCKDAHHDLLTQHSGSRAPRRTPCTMLMTRQREQIPALPMRWSHCFWVICCWEQWCPENTRQFWDVFTCRSLVNKSRNTAKHPWKHDIEVHCKEWCDLRYECIRTALMNDMGFKSWTLWKI